MQNFAVCIAGKGKFCGRKLRKKLRGKIAQRRITDYIQRCGGTTKVPVTKDLLTAAASGRQNYNQFLKKQKMEKRMLECKRKMDDAAGELEELKKKKQKLMVVSEDLLREADKLAAQAETKSNFLLLSRSNTMREKYKRKLEELSSLDKAIQEKIQTSIL